MLLSMLESAFCNFFLSASRRNFLNFFSVIQSRRTGVLKENKFFEFFMLYLLFGRRWSLLHRASVPSAKIEIQEVGARIIQKFQNVMTIMLLKSLFSPTPNSVTYDCYYCNLLSLLWLIQVLCFCRNDEYRAETNSSVLPISFETCHFEILILVSQYRNWHWKVQWIKLSPVNENAAANC